MTGLDDGRPRDPRPLIVTGAGDGTNRIFVVSQYGTIHVFPNDPNADEMKTFLDIRDRVQYHDKENEEGLPGPGVPSEVQGERRVLRLLHHQAHAENPHITRDLAVPRFEGRSQPRRSRQRRGHHADQAAVLESQRRHDRVRAGRLSCTSDWATAALANDPHGNGQNLGTLLGKILRIDVDHKDPGLELRHPEGQSVRRTDGQRGEIWAYGIRNMWRIAFDRETGTCGPATSARTCGRRSTSSPAAATTAGTSAKGSTPSAENGSGPRPDLIEPIWEYHHDVGKSITGGNVYRGKQVPELDGGYLYADFVTGQIWALWYDAEKKQVTANRTIMPKGLPVMSFGEDDDGEVYLRHARRRHPQIRLAENDGEPVNDH